MKFGWIAPNTLGKKDKPNYDQAVAKLSDLYTNFSNGKTTTAPVDPKQHDIIATLFRDKLIEGMKLIAPGLSESTYSRLPWAGLEMTTAYPDDQDKAIQDEIDKYFNDECSKS